MTESTDTATPRLATLIEVAHRGINRGERVLRIDGQDFAWLLSADGIHTATSTGELPSITITIPAEEVRFVHDADAPNAWGPGPEARAKLRAALGITDDNRPSSGAGTPS